MQTVLHKENINEETERIQTIVIERINVNDVNTRSMIIGNSLIKNQPEKIMMITK